MVASESTVMAAMTPEPDPFTDGSLRQRGLTRTASHDAEQVERVVVPTRWSGRCSMRSRFETRSRLARDRAAVQNVEHHQQHLTTKSHSGNRRIVQKNGTPRR